MKEQEITSLEWALFDAQLKEKSVGISTASLPNMGIFDPYYSRVLQIWERDLFRGIKYISGLIELPVGSSLTSIAGLKNQEKMLKDVIELRKAYSLVQDVILQSDCKQTKVFEKGSCAANAAYHALSGNIKRMLERKHPKWR